MTLILLIISLLLTLCLIYQNSTKAEFPLPKKYYRRKKQNTPIPITEPSPQKHFNPPKPKWVAEEIIRLKAIMGEKAGCRRIAHTFNQLHHPNQTVSKSYVANLIKNHQYQILKHRQHLKNKPPRAVPNNHTWAIDLSFYYLDNRINQAFLGILDHGSRKILCLHTLKNKSSWYILGYLCLTIAKYGRPKKIRTDNEAIFDSFVFKQLLKSVNIHHQKIPKASPWCNGRIERLFGTLKPILRHYTIPTIRELKPLLQKFSYWYNHCRPHQALKGITVVA